jgi:hypothetical protein
MLSQSIGGSRPEAGYRERQLSGEHSDSVCCRIWTISDASVPPSDVVPRKVFTACSILRAAPNNGPDLVFRLDTV